MESVVPALVAALFVISLAGGSWPHLRRWLENRRYGEDADRIPIAFPVENPSVPEPPDPRRPVRHSRPPGSAALANEYRSEAAATQPSPVEQSWGFDDASAGMQGRTDSATAVTIEPPVVPGRTFPRRPSKVGSPDTPSDAQPVQGGWTGDLATTPLAADAAFDLNVLGDVEGAAATSMAAVEEAPVVDGRSLRFHLADSRTMRLLPGRLEVEEGEDDRAEIRFVDIPGIRPEVTFGRRSGEPLRHIQLRSPTVSRNHARMRREGRAWVITNLSETNPIIVNGTTLRGADQERTLQDGDRIEMGDVVFRYRGG